MSHTITQIPSPRIQHYNPTRNLGQQQDSHRWNRAWALIPHLATHLRQQFGATQIKVFGSAIDRRYYTHHSDIDLVAWGIPPHHFYRALHDLNPFSPDFEIDLIDGDRISLPRLQHAIDTEGIPV